MSKLFSIFLSLKKNNSKKEKGREGAFKKRIVVKRKKEGKDKTRKVVFESDWK